MESSKASSNSITSSTVSSESALRSLMKCVSLVISLLSTPICSLTISITFCSVSSIGIPCLPCLKTTRKSLPSGQHDPPKADDYSGARQFPQPTCQPPITCALACFSVSFSLHEHSTIHTNDLSCDITRIRAGQKRHHRRY